MFQTAAVIIIVIAAAALAVRHVYLTVKMSHDGCYDCPLKAACDKNKAAKRTKSDKTHRKNTCKILQDR